MCSEEGRNRSQIIGDCTVTAEYEAIQLTVRFFTHSQSTEPYETRQVAYGTTITDPPTDNAPTGWSYQTYMTKEGGWTINNYVVKSDTDFSGIWKADIPISVTVPNEAGGVIIQTETATSYEWPVGCICNSGFKGTVQHTANPTTHTLQMSAYLHRIYGTYPDYTTQTVDISEWNETETSQGKDQFDVSYAAAGSGVIEAWCSKSNANIKFKAKKTDSVCTVKWIISGTLTMHLQ